MTAAELTNSEDVGTLAARRAKAWSRAQKSKYSLSPKSSFHLAGQNVLGPTAVLSGKEAANQLKGAPLKQETLTTKPLASAVLKGSKEKGQELIRDGAAALEAYRTSRARALRAMRKAKKQPTSTRPSLGKGLASKFTL